MTGSHLFTQRYAFIPQFTSGSNSQSSENGAKMIKCEKQMEKKVHILKNVLKKRNPQLELLDLIFSAPHFVSRQNSPLNLHQADTISRK